MDGGNRQQDAGGREPPPLPNISQKQAQGTQGSDQSIQRAQTEPRIKVSFDNATHGVVRKPIAASPLQLKDREDGEPMMRKPAQGGNVISSGKHEPRVPSRPAWGMWAAAVTMLGVFGGVLLWTLQPHAPALRGGPEDGLAAEAATNSLLRLTNQAAVAALGAATNSTPSSINFSGSVSAPTNEPPVPVAPTQGMLAAQTSSSPQSVVDAPARQQPVVWVATSDTALSQAEVAVFANPAAQCLLYSRAGRLRYRITRPSKAPLTAKYYFKTDDDSFRLDISKIGARIEGDTGNLSLVHLQNGCTNLVLVVAPLPLAQSSAGILECTWESPALELLATQLEVRISVDLPGLGVTNLACRMRTQQSRTSVDYASMEFVRAWQSKWESGGQARAKRLRLLQQEIANASSDLGKQLADAQLEAGLNLTAVKQALWGVMAQYERVTLQEVDRDFLEAERREQMGRNSFYNSAVTNSVRRRSSRGYSSGKTNYMSTVTDPARRDLSRGVFSSTTNDLEQLTQTRKLVRSVFARKDAVAAYQAALDLFQNTRTAESIRAAARQAVGQSLQQMIQTVEKDQLAILRCEVLGIGLDGQRVLVMQWSAKKQ
jgi:hypothetical protein